MLYPAGTRLCLLFSSCYCAHIEMCPGHLLPNALRWCFRSPLPCPLLCRTVKRVKPPGALRCVCKGFWAGRMASGLSSKALPSSSGELTNTRPTWRGAEAQDTSSKKKCGECGAGRAALALSQTLQTPPVAGTSQCSSAPQRELRRGDTGPA